MDAAKISARQKRYSEQAKILLEKMNELDLDDFERWFEKESEQTIIGSGTITAYLIHRKKYGY